MKMNVARNLIQLRGMENCLNGMTRSSSKRTYRRFFIYRLNFGRVMKKLDEKVRDAHATIPDGVCLSDHTSKWNMNVYLAVDKEIPGAENMTLSGTFLSKVYEGPFQDTGKWCKDFEQFASQQGYEDFKMVHVVYHVSEMCEKIWEKLRRYCRSGHVVFPPGASYDSKGHHP